ncbi:hypothetical protein ACF09C_24600 [Streptomyces sp. NPDC014870]|uniref:hypothetical protein n=1 Tax=Streptomyces sp. NPDC014870 TaxID=3364925 RepID=UPI0036FD9288
MLRKVIGTVAVAAVLLAASATTAMADNGLTLGDLSQTLGPNQTLVGQSVGNGGLISIGTPRGSTTPANEVFAGDVYACSHDDVNQKGLINMDVNAECQLVAVL